ncbi:MAG TPA: Ku protein [Chloroflexota bacterium]|nr:Ku protein [Chloroflexota bacterium]
MPRPIWKGAITFGMISIPVKLFGATESKDLAFNTLHKECKSRLKQKRWCPVDDREVFNDEVTKAYEYSKDSYVEITEEDLESLPLPSKHTIELTSFVKQVEIDPVYFERTYYLEPEEIGAKPYALLMRALKTKQVSAVAKIALRNKESLCVLRASENGLLMLETLYYPDEIRTADLQGEPEVLVSQPELTMALSLVEMLEEPFDPQKYKDQYRGALLEMIESKRNGAEIVATPETPLPQTVDLMAALKASLEAARRGKGASAAEAAASVEALVEGAAEEAAPEPTAIGSKRGKRKAAGKADETEELAVAF